MGDQPKNRRVVVDHLTLRFVGQDDDGSALRELRATHVAEVLLGLVGLTNDFDDAGVFHKEGPSGSEILVRPAQEGSFLIEVLRFAQENPELAGMATAATGIPSISTLVLWATKSARADVEDFDYLANGNVKVTWQDKTVDEVPPEVWRELKVRKRRRKKHLRQLMAPLSDPRVTELDVATPEAIEPDQSDQAQPEQSAAETPRSFVLKRADYDAVRPEDEVEEKHSTFDAEARMSAIDFDDPSRWMVKIGGRRARNVTVEDQEFLREVAQGLAIRPQDTFSVTIREDATVRNGRTTTQWTATKVNKLRRAPSDDGSQEHDSTQA